MRLTFGSLIVGLVMSVPHAALAGVGANAESRSATPSVQGQSDRPAPQRFDERSHQRTPARGSAADIRRYAARETQSNGARGFRAGDDVVVVIGASTITLILAIVLLVVLL
jgi:hypothetical protein